MPVTDEPHSAREKERERRSRRRQTEGEEVVLEGAEDMSIAICLKLKVYLFMLSCTGRGGRWWGEDYGH